MKPWPRRCSNGWTCCSSRQRPCRRRPRSACARWRAVDANQIAGAIARATCNAAASVAAQSTAAARTPALA
ncbi:MAG: hypothetical protein COC14_07580 [Burkholderiaceae bacterium]|nr:MAG: hypothetical protein COC14_07580 [Burkholderiaceae bacterium]